MIFFVTTRARTGAEIFLPFECNYGTVGELKRALQLGPVQGRQITYDKANELGSVYRVVRSRMPHTLTDATMIEPNHYVFLEEVK